MAITSNEERTANRLTLLEQRLDAFMSQDKPGSQLLTPGTIPFGGASGALATDPTFFWDNTNNRLGVNTATPRATLDVNGGITSADFIRTEAYSAPPTGEGLELGYSAGVGYVTAYKRTDSTFQTLYLRGSSVNLVPNGIVAFTANSATGNAMVVDTALTTTTVNALISFHRTSGTPGVGFGSDYYTSLDTNGGADRPAFLRRTNWATATDASRKARTDFFVFDTTNRLVLRMEASGTAAMLGFFGAAAVIRQVITGVRTGTLAQLQTVVANLLTGLANEGLITDSTT